MMTVIVIREFMTTCGINQSINIHLLRHDKMQANKSDLLLLVE